MGKGGNGRYGGSGEEENMAAWLVGIDSLKILPFKLPALGLFFFSLFFSLLILIQFAFILLLDIYVCVCIYRAS